MQIDIATFLLAFIGGGLPPLIWLWFWLKEDERNPEPRLLIAATFIGGMIAVPVALFVEQRLVDTFFPHFFTDIGLSLFISLFFIVLVEEVVKFLAFAGVALPNKNFNEPVDSLVYLITAALGFAALENSLFLIDSLSYAAPQLLSGEIVSANLPPVFINNSLRFIGANVLHVVSSGIIGIFLGYAFYKSTARKVLYGFIGIVLATLLHALFNFSIISLENKPLVVFMGLWVVAIILIFFFERIKNVTS